MDKANWQPMKTAPKDGTKILAHGSWEERATGRASDREIGIVFMEDRHPIRRGNWIVGQ